jgi:hypothetical protein
VHYSTHNLLFHTPNLHSLTSCISCAPGLAPPGYDFPDCLLVTPLRNTPQAYWLLACLSACFCRYYFLVTRTPQLNSVTLTSNELRCPLQPSARNTENTASIVVEECLPRRCTSTSAVRLGTAPRKHRFPYCCVIAALTDLRGSKALAWRKYAGRCPAVQQCTTRGKLRQGIFNQGRYCTENTERTNEGE